MNPALNPIPIRGNVDTRIEKVRRGEYDAAVLAAAGIARINRTQDIAEFFLWNKWFRHLPKVLCNRVPRR